MYFSIINIDKNSKNYKPKRDLDHIHLGSIGNLQLNAIRKKMDSIID